MVLPANEFQGRHDFTSDDLLLLANNFPHIEFSNIPEAWIIILDNALRSFDNRNVKSISQRCGFLIVKGNLSKRDWEKIDSCQNTLYKTDFDYFERLKCLGERGQLSVLS